MLASESTVLDTLGFNIIDDVEPGEAVFVDKEGEMFREACIENPIHTPCIFEYVYLARPDAVIDNISVHKSRMRMGEALLKRLISLNLIMTLM